MRIEFIFDRDCPNVEKTRIILKNACLNAGIEPSWQEWIRGESDSPDYCQKYGSPTIIIDGKDVAPLQEGSAASSCRIYTYAGGKIEGVPPKDMILKGIHAGMKKNRFKRSGWLSLPAIGTSILPSLTCPACWPAYAGLLSALGLGFVNYTPYMLPLTIVFILIALGGMLYKAKEKHGYSPFILASIGGVLLMAGRFIWNVPFLFYLGIAFFVAASLWNIWPKQKKGGIMTKKRDIEIFSAGCPACKEAISLVNRLACQSCHISVLDMHDSDVAKKAKQLGIRSIPAIVVDGKLISCCADRGPSEEALRAAGVGQP